MGSTLPNLAERETGGLVPLLQMSDPTMTTTEQSAEASSRRYCRHLPRCERRTRPASKRAQLLRKTSFGIGDSRSTRIGVSTRWTHCWPSTSVYKMSDPSADAPLRGHPLQHLIRPPKPRPLPPPQIARHGRFLIEHLLRPLAGFGVASLGGQQFREIQVSL